MLELLDARYADGVTGYCEAVQATVCNATSWCSFGNFSQAHVSPLFGFSGGLATSLQTMREFGKLYPHHFFHPVRAPPPKENKGAKILGGESEHYDAPLPRASSEELLRTLCRLANPPPIAWGRFEAPIGLPNHRQRMCDMKAHHECLWDHPMLTMTLGGANACLSTCRKTQGKHCPLACVRRARATETLSGGNLAHHAPPPVRPSQLCACLSGTSRSRRRRSRATRAPRRARCATPTRSWTGCAARSTRRTSTARASSAALRPCSARSSPI